MQITNKTKYLLGIQHVLAMFGATVLVPFLTGLNPSIALLTAGLGTLIFHQVTKKMVPVFLGSSFAFVGATALVLQHEGLGAVKAGLIGAGLVYMILAGLIKIFGVEKVKSFFPPVVVGPVIMVIGLRLAPIALKMMGYKDGTFDLEGLTIALAVILTMIFVSVLKKSFFRILPVLISVTAGYLLAAFLGLVDFAPIAKASWIGFSTDAWQSLTTLPAFSWSAMIAITPIALVVFFEHIGDITTNGAVVGKNFFDNPGVHRTLLGDGLATALAGLLGGPANTTYGENTGVLAITKVYNPVIIRIAAVYAILLSLIGKFGAILQTIPQPVMGGVSIILFGMIASIGIRTLVEADLNLAYSRNLIILSLILVLGIAISDITITESISVSGLAIAAFVGVLLHKLLPENV